MRFRPLENRWKQRKSESFHMLYHQCRFARGPERTIAWIEARGAKIGARVELTALDDDGPWEVVEICGAPLEAEALADLQRLNRKSLASIARIAWT